MKKRASLIILLLLASLAGYAQITIRIFARTRPSSVFFTVDRGHFIIHDGAAGERVADLAGLGVEEVAPGGVPDANAIPRA